MVLITFSILVGTCDPPTWSVGCGFVGCGALCTDLCIIPSLPVSQEKLEIKLEQSPYQKIFVPRSCIRSGLATQNLFTLDIHRKVES